MDLLDCIFFWNPVCLTLFKFFWEQFKTALSCLQFYVSSYVFLLCEPIRNNESLKTIFRSIEVFVFQ